MFEIIKNKDLSRIKNNSCIKKVRCALIVYIEIVARIKKDISKAFNHMQLKWLCRKTCQKILGFFNESAYYVHQFQQLCIGSTKSIQAISSYGTKCEILTEI